MAKVTKEFMENYDFWIARKIQRGEFTQSEADELKVMIRKDLTEGPDQLRNGPPVIDDHEERYRQWDAFFAAECKEMRESIGINARIRNSIAEEKRKAA